MQRDPVERKPAGHRVDEVAREREFRRGIGRFGKYATHEAARLARPGERHFRQHRLIGLDHRHAGGEQLGQFFAKHPDDVVGDVFA